MNLANLRKRRTRNPFERINPIPPREMNSLSFPIFLSQKLVKCVLHAPLFLSRRRFDPRGNDRLVHVRLLLSKEKGCSVLNFDHRYVTIFFFHQNIHQICQLLKMRILAIIVSWRKYPNAYRNSLWICYALRKTFGNLTLQRDTAIELIMLMKRMYEYYNEMYRTNEIF